MTTQATAAVARTPAGAFTIEPVQIEDPRPGEILVKIAGVGLCHTDIVFQEYLQVITAPAILGHEGSGIVEKVGEGVTKVKAGDHVVLTFNSCGECDRCTSGQSAYCFSFPLLNFVGNRPDGSSAITLDGEQANADFFGQSSFASYAVAHERNVIPVDADVPIELLGPLGCGVQTGAGAIINSMACRKGSSLAILGAGAVGLSAVMAGVVQGCSTIIVVEPKPARREIALELGATHVIDPIGADLGAAIKDICPRGVDYAFDTSGRKEVIEGAIAGLAPRATFGLVGVPPKLDDVLTIPLNQTIGAGHIFMGIIEGDAEPDQFIPEMVRLYREGRFPFDRLITTYRLDEINQAVADQHSGRAIKPVMLP